MKSAQHVFKVDKIKASTNNAKFKDTATMTRALLSSSVNLVITGAPKTLIYYICIFVLNETVVSLMESQSETGHPQFETFSTASCHSLCVFR